MSKIIKYSKSTYQKIEKLFLQQGYTIRYEKGNFTSGYCIVKDKKVIIINKYFDNHAKMNILIDLLFQIEVDENLFIDNMKIFYQKILTMQNDALFSLRNKQATKVK